MADETLNRIARTLEKDGAIATTPPARYCYTVARCVLLEDFRRELSGEVLIHEFNDGIARLVGVEFIVFANVWHVNLCQRDGHQKRDMRSL